VEPPGAARPPPSFELAVYTMGDRDYAAEMARLLDPEGRLFHGRVISSVRAAAPPHPRPLACSHATTTAARASSACLVGFTVGVGAWRLHL
jgi:hypothetical protein